MIIRVAEKLRTRSDLSPTDIMVSYLRNVNCTDTSIDALWYAPISSEAEHPIHEPSFHVSVDADHANLTAIAASTLRKIEAEAPGFLMWMRQQGRDVAFVSHSTLYEFAT